MTAVLCTSQKRSNAGVYPRVGPGTRLAGREANRAKGRRRRREAPPLVLPRPDPRHARHDRVLLGRTPPAPVPEPTHLSSRRDPGDTAVPVSYTP